jgi:Phospholipase_D-nuclease N-terminal/Short C-terminal domain
MIIFFAWIIWFWMLISILSDVFRRRDIGGGAKVLWTLFVIFLPFLGVFVYLLTQHDGMAERSARGVRAAQQAYDDHIRDVAGGAASEIERAKGLLDSGAITQAEFDALKAKALASA